MTESNGTVEVTIIKKTQSQDITFGYRTVADTAVPEKDYTHENRVVNMKKRDTELKINIPIVNDEEWNPDMDFFIELYDPNGTEENGEPPRFFGMDTRCKVTILDEDFPGTLGFAITDIRVQKGSKNVEVVVSRIDGADGTINCMIGTEPLSENQAANNAIEFEDYLPMYEKITFMHGETEKIINVTLVAEKIPNIQEKEIDDNQVAEENGSEEEEMDRIFKIKLEKPEPSEVKISKKNVCMVTIVQHEDVDKDEEDKQKLIEFYMSQADPTWAQQFKQAVMLGPQLDQDNMVLEEVDWYEAFCHFTAIGWKVFFALIPPNSIWGGKAAFIIALAMIGLVTAVVGELATVLGCVAGISESTTAITLVALGTSLPDTFASMTAARTSDYADAAIGNITGSNSVNVFLGLGLPWVIAAQYTYNKHERDYVVPAGDVAFSVFVFLVVAIVCFFVLIIRRAVSTN